MPLKELQKGNEQTYAMPEINFGFTKDGAINDKLLLRMPTFIKNTNQSHKDTKLLTMDTPTNLMKYSGERQHRLQYYNMEAIIKG